MTINSCSGVLIVVGTVKLVYVIYTCITDMQLINNRFGFFPFCKWSKSFVGERYRMNDILTVRCNQLYPEMMV